MLHDADVAAAADSLVADLRNVFGDRLLAVVAYGPRVDGAADAPLTSLALVDSLSMRTICEACAQFAPRLEPGATGDAAAHAVAGVPCDRSTRSRSSTARSFAPTNCVYGDDPFRSAAIAPDDLRRACELQAKSHLLHLREGVHRIRRPPQRCRSTWSPPRRQPSLRCSGTLRA